MIGIVDDLGTETGTTTTRGTIGDEIGVHPGGTMITIATGAAVAIVIEAYPNRERGTEERERDIHQLFQ